MKPAVHNTATALYQVKLEICICSGSRTEMLGKSTDKAPSPAPIAKACKYIDGSDHQRTGSAIF